jgi:hypothetical protein
MVAQRLASKGEELASDGRVHRSERFTRVLGQEAAVRLAGTPWTGVDQVVTIMLPVCQIVENSDAPCRVPPSALQYSIGTVIVDYEQLA